jgi:hypothetical protein
LPESVERVLRCRQQLILLESVERVLRCSSS